VKNIKSIWKKIWYFIWEDDSVYSWIVNIILAYVLIKFIVYPGLGFLLGTGYPIVAVVSNSMTHDGNYDEWWNSENARCINDTLIYPCSQADYYGLFGISKEEFKNYPFRNGFNKGDIMILYGKKPEKIESGDIIVYSSSRPDPIIHRVIKTWENSNQQFFQTKGDHNPESYNNPRLNEHVISENNVLGVAAIRIPLLGWIKIIFVEILKFAHIID